MSRSPERVSCFEDADGFAWREIEGAWGGFDDGSGLGGAEDDTPGRDVAADVEDGTAAVEHHDVDREPHEAGVERGAGTEQEPVIGGETGDELEASQSAEEGGRQGESVEEHASVACADEFRSIPFGGASRSDPSHFGFKIRRHG